MGHRLGRHEPDLASESTSSEGLPPQVARIPFTWSSLGSFPNRLCQVVHVADVFPRFGGRAGVKTAAVLGSAAILWAALPLVGTVPAAKAATNHSMTIDLSGTTCDNDTTVDVSPTNLLVAPGDLVTFTVTNNVNDGGAVRCGFAIQPSSGGPRLTGWIRNPNSENPFDMSSSSPFAATEETNGSFTRVLQAGSVSVDVSVSDLFSEFNTFSTIRVTAVSAGDIPADLIQQFAIDPGGDCTSVPAPIELFDVPRAGGWSKSWAQWPNEGAGGFVCTRQVMYQPSTGTWVPRTSS